MERLERGERELCLALRQELPSPCSSAQRLSSSAGPLQAQLCCRSSTAPRATLREEHAQQAQRAEERREREERARPSLMLASKSESVTHSQQCSRGLPAEPAVQPSPPVQGSRQRQPQRRPPPGAPVEGGSQRAALPGSAARWPLMLLQQAAGRAEGLGGPGSAQAQAEQAGAAAACVAGLQVGLRILQSDGMPRSASLPRQSCWRCSHSCSSSSQLPAPPQLYRWPPRLQPRRPLRPPLPLRPQQLRLPLQ